MHVGLCAGYDSLPGIGHARGHDIIAAAALGRSFPNAGEWEARPSGSTDLGNVSRIVPAIHPMIGIESLPAVNHQPEFAARCVSAPADKALGDGALAMAWTCIDLARRGIGSLQAGSARPGE